MSRSSVPVFLKFVLALGLFLPGLSDSEKPSTSPESHIQRRLGERKEKQEEKQRINQHWPDYSACQDMDEQPIPLEERLIFKTEAGFCEDCQIRGQSTSNPQAPFEEVVAQSQKNLRADFEKKLKNRAVGLIESKIFQIQALRACLTEDKNWLSQKMSGLSSHSFSRPLWSKIKNRDSSFLESACKKRKEKLLKKIQNSWSDMRVSLALSNPSTQVPMNYALNRMSQDSFSVEKSASDTFFEHFINEEIYLDESPAHPISGFSSMPQLNKEEKNRARNLYFKALTEPSLESHSPSEFKSRILNSFKSPSSAKASVKKQLSKGDMALLLEAVGKLKEDSEQRYFQITSEMPVLTYLENDHPTAEDLDQAYGKMQENLEDFLKELDDMPLLLSFRPLVEELLKENPQYCLVAERARIQMEKNENLKDNLLLGSMFIAMAPCFMAGPISIAVCLTAELGLGFLDVHYASVAKDHSLGRALAGKQFEKISELKSRDKELELSQIFLPLIFLEVGVVSRAVKQSRKKLRGSTSKKRPKGH